MGFGREDYVDYTLLKKKGILRVPEKKKTLLKEEGGFVDFTAFGSQNNEPAQQSQSPITAMPNFDFLGNMAGVGASQPTNANPLVNLDNSISSGIDPKEINALKIKIEDMEYKLDRFIERLDKMEEGLSKN